MSNWTLSEHILNHLKKKRLGDIRPPALWPSEGSCVTDGGKVLGACRRSTFFRYAIAHWHFSTDDNTYEQLVNDLTAVEVPTTSYLRWIWEAGKLYEDFVIEQAKQSGVYVADQIQVVIPAYNIVGKLDLITTNPETGGYIADEVKSIYGFNADEILGRPSAWNKGRLGKPKDSNLIQTALYNWHLKSRLPNLEATRIFYGARDTGRTGEFQIDTFEDNGIIKIQYSGANPRTPAVVSPITITGILASYQYVIDHFNNHVIPPRDFNARYSDERVHEEYTAGNLGKTNKEAYEKILARKNENAELEAEGKKLKKELKMIELGDYQCGYCNWRNYCYNENLQPIND